jgi:hypothetical protein
MGSFDLVPKSESREETTLEIYRRTAISRITELVEDGTYPQQYADELIASVHLIEEGIVDPERDGLNFAEVGMLQIRAFREVVNVAEMQTVEMCNAALQQIDETWEKVKGRKVVPINILELTQAVESVKQHIEDSLKVFQTKVEEVRNLQAGLTSLTNFDGLEGSLSEFQVILEEAAKE